MSKAVLFTAVVLLASVAARAQCSPAAANIYQYAANGHHYEIIKENLTWADAAACAMSRGGKLAEINSAAEQDSLFAHAALAGIVAANTVAPDGGGSSYLWIGGNDLLVEGKWVWNGDNDSSSTQFWQGTSTGTPIGGLYNNWGNEPDNWTSQNALGLAITDWPMGVAGQWNDLKETNQLYYVIEYSSPLSVPVISHNDVVIYPNPVNNELKITFANLPAAGYTVKLVNLLGQTVWHSVAYQANLSIDVSGLSDRLLLVYITDAAGNRIYSQKIVKQ